MPTFSMDSGTSMYMHFFQFSKSLFSAMETIGVSGFLVLLVVAVTRISGDDHGEDQTYKIEDFGTVVKIKCTTKAIPNHSFQYWVLNDGTILTRSSTVYRLVDNGFTLHIVSAAKNHIGDYFCVLKDDNSESFAYFKSVVTKPEPTSWESVKNQVIASIIAGSVMVVLITGLCVVWHYRWRPEKQDIIADCDSEAYGKQDKGHSNPAWKDENEHKEFSSVNYSKDDTSTKF